MHISPLPSLIGQNYKETQSEGMDIMDQIKKEFSLKVVTEVTEIKYLDRISKPQTYCNRLKEYKI